MKNFRIYLMAVAAMVALSCTTDATQDLGVGAQGPITTITLSLDDTTKTILGEKSGEEYPLYWSEGDQISINGVASSSIVISESNAATATFTFGGELTTPYLVTYPAALNGQVVFQPEQTHTSSASFGNGVTTMYGYSEDGNGIALNHLSGVLKIGVTGEAVLTKAQISTVDRKPIAGGFLIDYTKGEVTATEAATPIIEYSFGEGLQLSSEAQYMHIAVPAGIYTELYVTLYDNAGGAMYATVKSGEEKPLAAGKVREFKSNIAYQATSSEQKFLISSPESLKAFAEAVDAGTAEAPAKIGVLVNDIDMSEVTDWKPVSGHAVALNGNGYAIKGMTKPLFDTVNMEVKGLHLTGVKIVETEKLVVGAIARYLEGTMSHCSAQGSIEVNNSTYAESTAGSYMDINVGGLLGRATASTIEYCESDVTVSLVRMGATGYAAAAGGAIGAVLSKEAFDSKVDNIVNYGDVVYKGTLHKSNMYLSGVVGRLIAPSVAITMTNLTNYGDVYTSTDCVNKADYCLGGITGTISASNSVLDGWTNYGHIYGQGNGYNFNVAGMIAYQVFSPLTNSHNYGKVSAIDFTITGTKHLYASGIATESRSRLYNVVNHKEATITVKNGVITDFIYAGGIVAYHKSANYFTEKDFIMNVKNEADIVLTNVDLANASYIGGLAGQATRASGDATHSPYWYKSSNSGNITLDGVDMTDNKRLSVAGLFGLKYIGVLEDCENTGDITIKNGAVGQDIMVGGITGYQGTAGVANLAHTHKNTINRGDISVHASSVLSGGDGGVFAGGILGQIFCNNTNNYTYLFNGCKNYGDITVSGTWNKTYGVNARYGHCIGGFGGDILGDVTLTDCHNYGNIKLATSSELEKAMVGGFLGLSYTRNNEKVMNMTNCSNQGKVEIVPTAALTTLRVGGFIGMVQDQYDYVYNVDGCYNKGAVSIGDEDNIVSISTLYAGGLFGSICESTSESDTTTVVYKNTNYSLGDITVRYAKVANPTTSYVGGAIGITTLPMNNIESHLGLLVVDGKSTANYGHILGMPRAEGTLATDCKVGGWVSVEIDEEDESIVQTYLTESNYYNYIYGSGKDTDWTGTSNYDGSTFISEKPVIK